ncbi:MAG: response regulator [Candidatus Omnitrophica bacterium]|nr:response regulator [Candidatus Omnitrophota bacterium]
MRHDNAALKDRKMAKAKKVLIVDDEQDILKVAVFRLESLGYEVLTAVDGKEALALMRRECPDVLILDLRLPVMDGYEVCRRMRADNELRSIPIILFTACVIDEIAHAVKRTGAADLIVKPFSAEDLLEKVKKIVK